MQHQMFTGILTRARRRQDLIKRLANAMMILSADRSLLEMIDVFSSFWLPFIPSKIAELSYCIAVFINQLQKCKNLVFIGCIVKAELC